MLPSGTRSRVAAFEDGGEQAAAPRSVAVALADELDVGRGDLLARAAGAPEPVRELTRRSAGSATSRPAPARATWSSTRPARSRPGSRRSSTGST